MILALKLILTPAVITLATLAGRRFGRSASGWFVGLPLTSGPIAAFLAIEQGRPFAAHAANGSLGGAIGEVGFCAAYATAARRTGWRRAALAGSGAFAAIALVLESLPLSTHVAVVIGLATVAACSLAAGLVLVRHVHAAAEAPVVLPSRWDIPARAVVATAFLLALTSLATTFGPRLSGLIAVYPLYTVVLAAFAHAHEGEAGAVQVLRGLLVGLFSFVSFYALLAILLTRTSTAEAFLVAALVALAVQGATLVPLAFASVSGDRFTRARRRAGG